jgi:hypothetical protein
VIIVITIISSIAIFIILIIVGMAFHTIRRKQEINELMKFPEYKHYLELEERNKHSKDDFNKTTGSRSKKPADQSELGRSFISKLMVSHAKKQTKEKNRKNSLRYPSYQVEETGM